MCNNWTKEHKKTIKANKQKLLLFDTWVIWQVALFVRPIFHQQVRKAIRETVQKEQREEWHMCVFSCHIYLNVDS